MRKIAKGSIEVYVVWEIDYVRNVLRTDLKRLGIEMHNALVCNARAKPIERIFSTIKKKKIR